MQVKNRRADRVWDRLIQSYGTRVAEMYGADMPKPWVDAIDDLSDEQVKYGLRMIIHESPIHPPALGQFLQCCANMPMAQRNDGPSIQAQLCEYAAQHVHDLSGPIGMTLWEYSRPWTYVYREWRDETRPKGLERCAECIGLVIELDNGKRIGWSVATMLADTEGHAKALKAFRPGPKPTDEQMRTWHGEHAEISEKVRVTPP
jgi:hypothetical protein